MKPRSSGLLFAALLGAALAALRLHTPTDPGIPLQRGTLDLLTPLNARLEPADPLSLRAEMDGLAKLTWLLDDGSPVEAGDLLARFDPSALEEQRLLQERDLRLAETELRLLREARHPLELQALQRELAHTRTQLEQEQTLLHDTRDLVAESLLPPSELERQLATVRRLSETHDALQLQLATTRDILHPALLEQASTRLDAARAALDLLDQRLARAVVRAPIPGTVSLPWIPIDGDRRPVRVGDGLYKNQVFLELADLTRLLLSAGLRERDLPLCPPGAPVTVHFPALPGRSFSGHIAAVSPRPRGDDALYPASIHLDSPDPALRPGLSARVEVLSARHENALLIPRSAVRFGPNGPETLREGTLQSFVAGPGDATHLVVLSGLNEGDRVRAP